MDATNLLYSTCQRLKQELGKDPDFAYDDMEVSYFLISASLPNILYRMTLPLSYNRQLKNDYRGELGATQALNQQLLAQIDDLEEERLRLLKVQAPRSFLTAFFWSRCFSLTRSR